MSPSPHIKRTIQRAFLGRFRQIERADPRQIRAAVHHAGRGGPAVPSWKHTYVRGERVMAAARERALQPPLVDLPAA
jgi:hypothetical protein